MKFMTTLRFKMCDEKVIEGSGWRRHDIKLSLILPPSRKECPASTDITRRGKTPAIPTSIVAEIEYSQASFFAKTFETSGRYSHSSKSHQLSLSVGVTTLRDPVRWIFTLVVSETRTESHTMRSPEIKEIVAILTTSPMKVWELLTPQPRSRALYGVLFWCFGFGKCMRPRYQSPRECVVCVVYGMSVPHVWWKIMHYKLTLNPGCLSFPPKTIDRQVRKIERVRVEGCCKLIQIHARVSGVYVTFLRIII